MGGMMEACCLQPIDVIKTRLQLDRAGKYQGGRLRWLGVGLGGGGGWQRHVGCMWGRVGAVWRVVGGGMGGVCWVEVGRTGGSGAPPPSPLPPKASCTAGAP